jgi:hypothetical protein
LNGTRAEMRVATGFVLASVFALAPQTLASGMRVSVLHAALGSSSLGDAPAAQGAVAKAGQTPQVGAREASKQDAASAATDAVMDLDAGGEDRFIRAGAPNRQVLIPKQHCRAGAKHDVLVHFHGVPISVEPSVRRSGLDAVVVIVNWGLFSGPYEDYFQPRGALTKFLDGIERTVDQACGVDTGGIDRLALSSWSAGYGAIYRILLHPEDGARVDALLMSDGMHVGYVRRGQVNPESMQVFADFARRAIAGEKLFGITHSDITPDRYASTRDTADYLIAHENVVLKLVDEQGPRPKMRLTSRADQGNFHVQGFAGMVADDHCQHLHALGETLFPLLKTRWAARKP